MERKLTRKEAEEAFQAVVALREEIAFGWLLEGCECRAQLMIEHLQTLGFVPGRAWAVAVGRLLTFPIVEEPGHWYKWGNHVAPVLSVEEVEDEVQVIDPSLTSAGPLTILEWAGLMRARSIEISTNPLSQAEILARHATRALQGQDLDAVVFILPLGVAPVPEKGGTGFRLDPDPPESVSTYAHQMMGTYLTREKQKRGKP